MSIKIDKKENITICYDEETNKECVHNGEICECSIYSGNPKDKNNFQTKG